MPPRPVCGPAPGSGRTRERGFPMPYSMCGALVALALGLPLTATAGPARSQKDAAEAARARRAGKSSVSPVRSAATPGRSAPALDELSARRRTSSGANYSGSVARGAICGVARAAQRGRRRRPQSGEARADRGFLRIQGTAFALRRRSGTPPLAQGGSRPVCSGVGGQQRAWSGARPTVGAVSWRREIQNFTLCAIDFEHLRGGPRHNAHVIPASHRNAVPVCGEQRRGGDGHATDAASPQRMAVRLHELPG